MATFKDIPICPSRYAIDTDGNILDKQKNRIIKNTITPEYVNTTLFIDGKRYHFKVHRLVALTYLPNPNKLPIVNHIDGNKHNCKLSNLEWATPTENNYHANVNGLSNSRLQKNNRIGFAGIRITRNGKFLPTVNVYNKQYYGKVSDDLQKAAKERQLLKAELLANNIVSLELPTQLRRTIRPIHVAYDLSNDIGGNIDNINQIRDYNNNEDNDKRQLYGADNNIKRFVKRNTPTVNIEVKDLNKNKN